MKVLLSKGADIETKDDFWQETALHKASFYGHIEVARLLKNGKSILFQIDMFMWHFQPQYY